MFDNAPKIEIGFDLTAGPADPAGYGVAQVLCSAATQSAPGVGERVLAPWPADGRTTMVIGLEQCVWSPANMPAERLILVPRLALALLIWEAAGLELGELATYTSGSSFEGLVALVAGWRSGRDALRIDLNDGTAALPPGTRAVDVSTPQRAIEDLHNASREACGFASVVFSRGPEAIEMLLEAMPVWGRLVVATSVTEPATIDFYNNVHRKGVRVIGVPSTPLAAFDAGRRPTVGRSLRRALRIMNSKDLGERCMAVAG